MFVIVIVIVIVMVNVIVIVTVIFGVVVIVWTLHPSHSCTSAHFLSPCHSTVVRAS